MWLREHIATTPHFGTVRPAARMGEHFLQLYSQSEASSALHTEELPLVRAHNQWTHSKLVSSEQCVRLSHMTVRHCPRAQESSSSRNAARRCVRGDEKDWQTSSVPGHMGFSGNVWFCPQPRESCFQITVSRAWAIKTSPPIGARVEGQNRNISWRCSNSNTPAELG